MTDDIVTVLRSFSAYGGEGATAMDEAADEIERLRNAQRAMILRPEDWLVVIAPDDITPEMNAHIRESLPSAVRNRTILVAGKAVHRG